MAKRQLHHTLVNNVMEWPLLCSQHTLATASEKTVWTHWGQIKRTVPKGAIWSGHFVLFEVVAPHCNVHPLSVEATIRKDHFHIPRSDASESSSRVAFVLRLYCNARVTFFHSSNPNLGGVEASDVMISASFYVVIFCWFVKREARASRFWMIALKRFCGPSTHRRQSHVFRLGVSKGVFNKI